MRRTPKYATIEQMELESRTFNRASLRLWRGVPQEQSYAKWLIVEHVAGNKFKYIQQEGERTKTINRAQAIMRINKEWGV